MPDIPVPTLEEVTEELLGYLPSNFPVRNPDAFSAFGTYLRLAAQVGLDVRATLRALLPQLFVTTATGEWLDEHARGLGLARKVVRPARLRARVEASGAGTFPPGALVGLDDLRYRVEGPFAPGAEVVLTSEGVGARYNLPEGTRLYPVTVVPGVEHLQVLAVEEPGLDRETDEELRARCLLSWPALGLGSTYHAYMSWALEDPEVRKVVVLDDHPRGQGTVDVVIAPAQGLPSAELIARVQAVVDARRPLTVNALVRGPRARTLDLALRLYLEPGAPAPEVWAGRASAFLHSLGIGEAFWPSRLMDTLHGYGGLRAVELLSPAGSVSVAQDELIVPGSVAVEAVNA
ncbi:MULTISPECIES: baseplate J/gp47 family protein [Thermus]|uniref:baseplate J/gp47 family protein n=1 Tax=Thermus brockianus TaxID=56956 RepID=UPI001F1D9456|nr:baseplate J/gp47 family protein [Thermus brockianus]